MLGPSQKVTARCTAFFSSRKGILLEDFHGSRSEIVDGLAHQGRVLIQKPTGQQFQVVAAFPQGRKPEV